ncbi:MAG: class I SAM-dependent methyltransferase [Myxococcota bacterium]
MNLRTVEEYRVMMADRDRMRIYQNAIRKHCPGQVVCEIGVGLAPLTLMALEAGAKRVYGIEALKPVLETATRIVRAAGYGPDRFVPLAGMSYEVELPERVDVVVSETLDSVGLGENTVACMSDVADRFLKPGGTMLPSHLGCAMALATPAAYDVDQRFWRETMKDDYGLDYASFADELSLLEYTLPIAPDEVKSEWATWQEVDLANPKSMAKNSGVLLEVRRAGRITGLATAFVAVIGDGMLDTFPGRSDTHWQQGFLPMAQPIDAVEGDLIAVSLTVPEHRALTLRMRRQILHVPAAHAAAFRRQVEQALSA